MASRWRTKSVEQSIADTDEPDTRLRKELTWLDLAVFGVAVVIGAGIFTVTASTTGDITGPAIWISFVIAAATCALAALCYAEFASTLPVAGSAYTFSYATFGEFLAWIIGWNLLLELAIGAAVVSKGWSSYLGTVFGFAGGTVKLGAVQLDWGALLIVAAVSTLIALGTKLSSRFSQVVTAHQGVGGAVGRGGRRLLHQVRQLLAVHSEAGSLRATPKASTSRCCRC